MQRLKTRAQFQAVLAGTIVAKTPHFALHRNQLDTRSAAEKIANPGDLPALFRTHATWIGAMVPKRWAKRAVTRNAIKRQIYALSAEVAPLYPQAAFVVRLRATFPRSEFSSAFSEPLRHALRAEVHALMLAGASAA